MLYEENGVWGRGKSKDENCEGKDGNEEKFGGGERRIQCNV